MNACEDSDGAVSVLAVDDCPAMREIMCATLERLGFALSRDVLAYGLLGGGLAAVEGRTYGYAEPEAGLIVEEIGAMKTLLSARWNYNQLGSGQGLSAVRLTQIKPFGTRYALVAEVEGSFGGRARQYDGQIALKRYF